MGTLILLIPIVSTFLGVLLIFRPTWALKKRPGAPTDREDLIEVKKEKIRDGGMLLLYLSGLNAWLSIQNDKYSRYIGWILVTLIILKFLTTFKTRLLVFTLATGLVFCLIVILVLRYSH